MNAYGLAIVFVIAFSALGVITGLNLKQAHELRLENRLEKIDPDRMQPANSPLRYP